MKKRTTVYLEDDLIQMLKLRSIRTKQSMSDCINQVLSDLLEEEEDIREAHAALKEPSVPYGEAMKKLGIANDVSG